MSITIATTYAVEYGSTIIGGSSTKFLLRKRGFGIFENYRTARVDFEVIVRGDTESVFLANNQELLDAFRTIRQRVQVKTPDGLRDYNPATNTGFNAEPEIEINPSAQNGPKFRNYKCSITVDFPADLTGQSGRRDNTVKLNYEVNRRRMYTFSGTYTALASNDATAQYTAAIEAYESSQLPAGNWQFVDQEISVDDTDKILEFTRNHKLITLNQAVGVANHDSVTEQSINIKSIQTGGSNSYVNGRIVKPLATYSVNYTAKIDITVTPASGMAALYESTLKPHLLAEIAANLRSTSGASIDNEEVEYDLENNEIRSSFAYRALNGSSIVEANMSKQLIDTTGIVHTSVTTGRDHQYAKDKGPPERMLRVTVMEKVAGSTFYDYVAPKNYDLLRSEVTGVEEIEGKSPNVIRFKRRTKVYEFKYAIEYTGGGGGTVQRMKPLAGLENFNGDGI